MQPSPLERVLAPAAVSDDLRFYGVDAAFADMAVRQDAKALDIPAGNVRRADAGNARCLQHVP